MPPYQGGGEMIETVTVDAISYNDPPYRFEAGTPPIAEAAALAPALDYITVLPRSASAPTRTICGVTRKNASNP